MKVSELITKLSKYDQDLEVRMMGQPKHYYDDYGDYEPVISVDYVDSLIFGKAVIIECS